MASPNDRKHVIVLGAGVIGLTTALKIHQKGSYKVTIIAISSLRIRRGSDTPVFQQVPTMSVSLEQIQFKETFFLNSCASAIDLETFKTMWNLSEPDGEAPQCFLRLPQSEFYRSESNYDTLKLMPGFSELPKEFLVPNSVAGITYNTVNTDAPVFLNYLLFKFLASGGSIVKAAVDHIDQVIEGGAAAFTDKDGTTKALPSAIINCLGLGARVLGGVEDHNVYPVRGQTVLIRAPWIQRCISLSGGPDKIWTYVIPRRSGDVIIGGTYEPNDWYSHARPKTTTDILTLVLEICPEIAPPEIRAQRTPTIDDVRPIIIEESCGLRPCRKDGPRLEAEWIEAKSRRIPVIHNYGHGGFGYIACYGSASVACKLMEEALSIPS